MISSLLLPFVIASGLVSCLNGDEFIKSFVREYLAIPIGPERENREVKLHNILKKNSFRELKNTRTKEDWLKDVLERTGKIRCGEAKLVQSYKHSEWIKDAMNQKQKMERIILGTNQKWAIVNDIFQKVTQKVWMDKLSALIPARCKANTYEVTVPTEVRRVFGKRTTEYFCIALLTPEFKCLSERMLPMLGKAVKAWTVLYNRESLCDDHPIDCRLVEIIMENDYDESMTALDVIRRKLELIEDAILKDSFPSEYYGKLVAGYFQLLLLAIREKRADNEPFDKVSVVEKKVMKIFGYELDELVNMKFVDYSFKAPTLESLALNFFG